MGDTENLCGGRRHFVLRKCDYDDANVWNVYSCVANLHRDLNPEFWSKKKPLI